MMRTPELKKFAQKHGLNIITIADLIEYRKHTETFVHRISDVDFPSKYGHFRLLAYENTLNSRCDLAVVKGDVRGKENVLVRVHSECLTGDALGSMRCDCGDQLAAAMRQIEAEGEGTPCRIRGAIRSRRTSNSALHPICATTGSVRRFSPTSGFRRSA